jgi:predicted MPP superfamily phosphohydrolase
MRVRRLLLLVVAFGLALIGWCYWTAIADSVVREADISLPDWPAGVPPMRVLLMSDIHVAGPDMPPERVARIVEQANALHPDIVFIAGDFISDRRVSTHDYSFAEAMAPLAGLRSRLGTVAVLGNHDHWRDAAEARAALRHIGVRLLDNDAVELGPLAVGGLDDPFTRHEDLGAMLNALSALPGARIVLSHSPDPFPVLPRDVDFMLAGHTHCGQIRLPLIGALSTMSAYGDRYACGLIRENGRTLIVSAGLGTSLLPLRLGAVPDMWLIRLGPGSR